MKAFWLYRLAAVLFILFAAGHTFGFLHFKPPTREASAVFAAMNSTAFQVGNSSFSYGAFYRGFGLYVGAYLLFSAFLSWHLGGLAYNLPQAVGDLGWIFFGLQLASLILSWVFFSTIPALFSAVLAACLGCAAGFVSLRRAR
jgi:hypothetical protein